MFALNKDKRDGHAAYKPDGDKENMEKRLAIRGHEEVLGWLSTFFNTLFGVVESDTVTREQIVQCKQYTTLNVPGM